MSHTILTTRKVNNFVIEQAKGEGRQEIFYVVNGRKMSGNSFWSKFGKYFKKNLARK